MLSFPRGDKHEFCLVVITFNYVRITMFAVAQALASLVHDCIE